MLFFLYALRHVCTYYYQIDWVYKIAKAFYEAGVSIDADLRLTVTSPDYFEALVSLLDETPSRTIGEFYDCIVIIVQAKVVDV